MSKKDYTEFMKLLAANSILIKEHDLLVNSHLKAAIALSKIINDCAKKMNAPKLVVKNKPKEVVSLRVRLEVIRSIKKNLN